MNNEEILKGNKLIAGFMGAEFKKVDYFGNGKITDEIIFKEHPSFILSCGRIFSSFSDLKYHLSWDWLKPVVDKIFTYGLMHKNEVKKVSGMSIVVNIVSCWGKVVEFIKWYNQNK